MKQNQSLVRRERSSTGVTIWSIVGGAMIVAAAAALIVSIPDISAISDQYDVMRIRQKQTKTGSADREGDVWKDWRQASSAG